MNKEIKIKSKIDEYIGKAGSAIPYNKLLADVLTSIVDSQQPIMLTQIKKDALGALSKESYLKVIDAYKWNKMQNLVLQTLIGPFLYISGYGLSDDPGLGQIFFGETVYPVCLGEVVISPNNELPIDGIYTTSTIANAFGLSEEDWLSLWNAEVVVACPNMNSGFPFDSFCFSWDEENANTRYLYNTIFEKKYTNFHVIHSTDEDKWQITSKE